LPEGTPFGLVGTSSLYKRESYPNGKVPDGGVNGAAANTDLTGMLGGLLGGAEGTGSAGDLGGVLGSLTGMLGGNKN